MQLRKQWLIVSTYDDALSEEICHKWFHNCKKPEFDVDDEKPNIKMKEYKCEILEALVQGNFW